MGMGAMGKGPPGGSCSGRVAARTDGTAWFVAAPLPVRGKKGRVGSGRHDSVSEHLQA